MIDVRTQTTIDRPVEQVAPWAADPVNAPRWYDNIISAEPLSDAPFGVGSRTNFVATFLGRRLEYTYEVTEYAPGRRLVMSTTTGPFPMETTYEWEVVATDATRMTLRNRGRPAGVGRIFGGVMAPLVRRANRGDLARLKAVLEEA